MKFIIIYISKFDYIQFVQQDFLEVLLEVHICQVDTLTTTSPAK